jgi:hypothetical protein
LAARWQAVGRQVRRRKSYAEARPDTVALAKELHANRLSYRKIAAELAARGHLTGGANRMQHRQFRKCSGSGLLG